MSGLETIDVALSRSIICYGMAIQGKHSCGLWVE